MKRNFPETWAGIVISIFLILNSSIAAHGQVRKEKHDKQTSAARLFEIPETARQRNEIYFSFQVKAKQEISTITRLISIDRIDGNLVKAYSTVPQFVNFLKLGYEVTVLPSPGIAEGITMAGNTILGPLTTWNFYPTYPGYESIMAQFQAMYPTLCNLDTITTLASGRRLLVLKISDNVTADEPEPEFLYTSSIHGDETTGYILMLHLADYLLSNYGINQEATDLINNLEIFICPLANPDGTYYSGNNSVNGARRYNANGVDLNRNYPDMQDGPHPDGNAWQPETVAFMDFATQHHFVAGANFHGGVEVVNYPWDTWSTLHADDNWYQFISRVYADTVHLHAISGYMNYLNNGITNGYAWYEVDGGRQDYMNYYHHCREVTIELSDVKLLPVSQLIPHWNYNWRSLILMMKHATYGIHGIVTSQVSGTPVSARVFINGHDNNGSEVYASAAPGDYHRLLKAGTYTLEFSAPCYQTQVISNVVVTDYTAVNLNVQMIPGAGVTTALVSAVTGSTATGGGNVICEGNSPVTARGLCWSTAIYPLITGPHTTESGTAGAFTSMMTNLSPATTYHVRAYVTDGLGTVYGNDVQFTTECGTIATFPWHEGFENGGAIPACWTQQQVSNSGINWKFITGNGGLNPELSHNGEYNACLSDYTSADNKTRLITPPMNLTQLPSPGLKFWHTQEVWYGDQDKLSVYYRTSSTSSWILLATYTGNIPDWTLDSIPLPNPSADYSLCFEGNAKYGYGVCIDDVEISSPYPDTLHIQSSVVMNAQSVCFDALQYISVAGNSEIFMVQPGGSARFIAGQSIRFFPGTVVEPGGFLHGSITNSNIYCLQAGNSPDVLSGIERDHPHNQGISNPWILYPNPATGLIVLESKANEHDECTVEIINLRGEKMKSLSCQIKRKLFLQIQDLTDGVYLLRINHGNDFSAIRFIKTH